MPVWAEAVDGLLQPATTARLGIDLHHMAHMGVTCEYVGMQWRRSYSVILRNAEPVRWLPIMIVIIQQM